MPDKLSLFARLSTWLVASLLLLSACSSPESRREAFREKMGPPQPALEGSFVYFEKANPIRVTARLTASHAPRRAERSSDDESPSGPGGGFGGGPIRNEFGERMGPRPGGGRSGGGMAAFPRQALTLSFKNEAPTPVTVVVTDVISLLGNFVPIPDRATLAAGESFTLEPMRGSLANLDAMELKLALRVGSTTQSEVFILNRTPAP